MQEQQGTEWAGNTYCLTGDLGSWALVRFLWSKKKKKKGWMQTMLMSVKPVLSHQGHALWRNREKAENLLRPCLLLYACHGV